ncbi:MAG: hypothetical protein ACRET5_04215 [Steroidobacteraceae bacterium]
MNVTQMTELRQIALCEATPKRESRRNWRLDLNGRKVKQASPLSVLKRTRNSRGCGGRQRFTGVITHAVNAELPLGRDVEIEGGVIRHEIE